uniref:Uncharacterized protein n=1 Tax=Romanomermis culicivorax TaxID=13658 RepID=A0A915L0M5_ROMCU
MDLDKGRIKFDQNDSISDIVKKKRNSASPAVGFNCSQPSDIFAADSESDSSENVNVGQDSEARKTDNSSKDDLSMLKIKKRRVSSEEMNANKQKKIVRRRLKSMCVLSDDEGLDSLIHKKVVTSTPMQTPTSILKNKNETSLQRALSAERTEVDAKKQVISQLNTQTLKIKIKTPMESGIKALKNDKKAKENRSSSSTKIEKKNLSPNIQQVHSQKAKKEI